MVKKHKKQTAAENEIVRERYSFLEQDGGIIFSIRQDQILWATKEAADLLDIDNTSVSDKSITSLLPEIESILASENPETIKLSTNLHGIPFQINTLLPDPEHPELKLLFLNEISPSDSTIIRHYQEYMHQAVIQQMYDGLFLIQDERIRFLNMQLARLLGYTVDEIKGEPYTKFIHPDELARVVDHYQRRMAGENVPREYETSLVGKNGQKIDIALHAGLISYDGKPADFVVVRDLTSEKALQQSLSTSEERFNAVLQNLSEMIWIVDIDGTFTFVTPSTEKILGYEVDWLIGRNGFELIHPDDLESSIQALIEVDQNMQPGIPTEFRFKNKNGEWVFLEALGQNLKDDPEIGGLVLTIRDITERKLAENQLIASEQKYHSIIDLAPDGIITANEKGVVTSCNQAFLDLSGYELEDIIGKHFSRIPTLTRQDVALYAPVLMSVLKGEIHRNYEFRWKHADGSRRWGDAYVSLMRDMDGDRQIQAIVRDITEKKRTEMLFKALEQASTAITVKKTPEEIYQSLADIFSKIGISSIIFLLDEEKFSLYPAYVSSPSKMINQAEKLTQSRTEEYELPIKGFYPFDQIVKNRITTYHTSLEEIAQNALPGVPDVVIRNILKLFGYDRLIAAPIITRNKTTGILCVFSETLLERDSPAISLFAQQLSAAMEKAVLLERAQEEISYRTRAEQALRESEARLLSLINAFPEPTYLIDLDDRVLAANHSFITATGKDSSRILNNSIYKLLPEKIIEQRQAMIELVKAKGKPVAYEESRGKREYINYVHPVNDTGGELSRIAVFSIDITDQKQSEVRIKRLLDQQISLTQISVALSAQTSTDQIYDLICNHIRESLDTLNFQVSLFQPENSIINTEYFYSKNRILDSENISSINHNNKTTDIRSQVIQSGAPVSLTASDPDKKEELQKILKTEETFKHPDLNEEEIRSIRSLLLTPMKIGGITIGVVQVSSSEINAYDQADIEFLSALSGMTAIAIQNTNLLAQSQRQAQQVQQIIRAVPEGVILLSFDYEIILSNPAANSYLEILGEPAHGEPLNSLGNRSIEDILEKPPEGLWHELLVEHQSNPRYFEALARPLSTLYPLEGWVLVIREVTQEREVQQRIQQQERLAAVGQLAAGIAHDFNNIMVPIVLYAEMMQESEALADDLKERVEIILQQSHRAASLTQQILDFSRRSMIESIPLNLKPFLKEMKRLLERTLPENIHINLKIKVDEPVILADLTRMQQVFFNLALNAKDAMPEGGELSFVLDSIETTTDDHPPLPDMPPHKWIRIHVSDNGTGIPEEDLPHIFEPFFTTKDPDKGSGLGLAQVYGIIKQHNGYIDVESLMDSGAHFVIYMPEYTKEAVYVPKPINSSMSGSGEKVLIVEDDKAVRDAVAEVLTSLNYSCIKAESSMSAIDIYRKSWKEIAIVLSDLVMPGLGGLELLKRLQEINPEVKMVVMSGYPLAENEGIREEHAVAAWIQKPVQVQSVSEAVQTAIASKKDKLQGIH